MLGAIQLQLGTIALETEELSLSDKHYDECLEIINGHTLTVEVASVCLNLYMQLGILWGRRHYAKGLVYLSQAEDFYKQLKEINMIPIDYSDYFKNDFTFNEEDAKEKLEKAYTLILFYIAQAYASSNPLKSAVYCHQTLQRQFDSKDYEHIDWALNTATLSQFFMVRNGFKQAKHHLSAALFMFDEYKKMVDASVDEGEEYEAKLETYRHRLGDVSRCWIKYALNLLTNSKERLINTENIELTACTCTDLAEMDLSEFEVTKEDMSKMIFQNMDVSEYDSRVGHHFLLTMDDAKKVFHFAQSFVNSAIEYHTLNTHASDYVEIMQDYSRLYDVLAFYAEDPDVRCKIYKRSADILEDLQSAINPQYYMRYCRQNWYHLGSTYSDMLDIKLEKLSGTSRPTQHEMTKVNSLVEKTVANFTKFIDSFRNASGDLPSKISDGGEKVFLLAYFHIAAKQTKYATSDRVVLADRIQKSIDAYKALLAYCKANPDAGELIPAELQLADMMVKLLQLKIARINNVAPPPI